MAEWRLGGSEILFVSLVLSYDLSFVVLKAGVVSDEL